MSKPILCIDFDGVIHKYSKGWRDGSIYDTATEGFFEWAEKAAEHFDLVVYSSRSKDANQCAQMQIWLLNSYNEWRAETEKEAFGVHFSFVSEKPPAFLTIDDRCVRFDGDWSDPHLDPTVLREYKPWNMKPEILKGHSFIDIPVERVLDNAPRDLRVAILVGLDKDKELYMASSTVDVGTMLLLLERMKSQLIYNVEHGGSDVR